jgi:hypothetical protein
LFQNFQLQPFPPDSLYVLAKTPLLGSYKFFLGFLWNLWSIFQISTFTHFSEIHYTHGPRRHCLEVGSFSNNDFQSLERGDNFTKPESQGPDLQYLQVCNWGFKFVCEISIEINIGFQLSFPLILLHCNIEINIGFQFLSVNFIALLKLT